METLNILGIVNQKNVSLFSLAFQLLVYIHAMKWKSPSVYEYRVKYMQYRVYFVLSGKKQGLMNKICRDFLNAPVLQKKLEEFASFFDVCGIFSVIFSREEASSKNGC